MFDVMDGGLLYARDHVRPSWDVLVLGIGTPRRTESSISMLRSERPR